ncbi:hypothetical protein MAPG_08418 [Magnaporthiopsis poae ATCC 64411]|uniref:Uncharacterized protein n=1 Tax=Magnaporthiopsis poae (strain ATCC 64411 / 73-15) TaxID=644358 RepID=A0A0C4E7B1_MAGP6|nr:hypothetical protein MAPG_08418 [Magnaporthiopsis poae ATCC 64411]
MAGSMAFVFPPVLPLPRLALLQSMKLARLPLKTISRLEPDLEAGPGHAGKEEGRVVKGGGGSEEAGLPFRRWWMSMSSLGRGLCLLALVLVTTIIVVAVMVLRELRREV